MRFLRFFYIGAVLFIHSRGEAGSIIADHTCRDLKVIPFSAIQKAKEKLIIAYGHTSHGTQVWYGLVEMNNFINNGGLGISAPRDLYSVNSTGEGGALELRDNPFTGAYDLGNPDRVAWSTATRAYLDANPEVNVILWAWCYQVNDATEEDINLYINLMEQLITDYPNVQFVYMTGFLYGTGENGNLNIRNNQIRDHCRTAGRILYDFADIESYDPNALVNYMPLRCNDACEYDPDGDGIRDRNWATEWQLSHVQGEEWYWCSAMHSHPLNSNMKAYAAWWLWARLAGWSGADCPEEFSSDFNQDCKVNAADLALISAYWQTSASDYDIAPETGDGVINLSDFSEFMDHWLEGCYIPADLNQDRRVNLEDILRISQCWQTADPLCDIAPAEGDGIVNLNDLIELVSKWLQGTSL